MVMDNNELLADVVTESLEHVSQMESLLLILEENPEHAEQEVINNIFRSAHSIKGVTSFVGLNKIKELSHAYENVLNAIRKDIIKPTPNLIDVLLEATDLLQELLQNAAESDTYDIDSYLRDLNQLITGDKGASGNEAAGQAEEGRTEAEKKRKGKQGKKASGVAGAERIEPARGKKSGKLKKPLAFKPPFEGDLGPEGLKPDDIMSLVDKTDQFRFQVEKADLEDYQARGLCLYILRVDVFRDLQTERRQPAEFIGHLRSLGTIISASFDLEMVCNQNLDDLPKDSTLGLLFSTLIEPDLIAGAVNLPAAGVELVELEAIQETDSENALISGEEGAGPARPEENTSREKPALEPVLPAAALDSVSGSEAETIEAVKVLQTDTSLRVHVSLLDRLMNLAGELVLGRNQLMQAIDSNGVQVLLPIAQRIDLITSGLQAQVMQTRMQPLAKVFNKFSRLVRDLSRNLGKKVELRIEGQEVELDKTIIEGLSDPLVHLVRNSLDHGIEKPEIREARGKSPAGLVEVRAYHEAGQVNIEISDDGAGMDPEKLKAKALQIGIINEAEAQKMTDQKALELIFRAGFSTAEKVSEVSGRGVGMDVVKSALEKLGGTVDLSSTAGRGSSVRIKLPLTMAILPCLLVRVAEERYAIPQISLVELVRVRLADAASRIERVGDAEVLRLRGNLLPLVRLADILKVDSRYRDALSNELRFDRRQTIADRRSNESEETAREFLDKRSGQDRRCVSAFNILVLAAGDLEYGLIVDELEDTEEIVVKPLGRHIKEIRLYAGATIMGDGRVAPILDVSGLALEADLISRSEKARELANAQALKKAATGKTDMEKILLFNYSRDDLFAVPISLVARIERVDREQLETSLGRHSMQYRGHSLRLIMLDKHLPISSLPDSRKIFIIIFRVGGEEIGIVASRLVDERVVPFLLDMNTHRYPGVMGSMVVDSDTVMVLDIFELVDLEDPEWTKKYKPGPEKKTDRPKLKVLLVEDSDFFRDKIARHLEEYDFEVYRSENGQAGLEALDENYPVDLVITDIEMPVMNGYEMVKEIRADPRFKGLKIIACSSHAGDRDIEEGLKAGVDLYMVKLDREKLTAAIDRLFDSTGEAADN